MPNTTVVQVAALLSFVKEAGLETEEKKSGWIKVKAKKGSARLYIPVNKTGRISRVDIAELKPETLAEGLAVPPRKPNGRVYAELNQAGTEAEVLERFQLLCMFLAQE